MYELDQQKALDLNRGLFFVNYKSAEDNFAPPRVTVSAARGHEGAVQFILHPDATEPTLWGPNSGLVVRVSSRARLQVQVLPARAGGSRAATVLIEPINPGQLTTVPRSAWNVSGAEDFSTAALKVRGHVAGIGDVVVGANAWIAGPSTPSRIEGFALDWPDKPVDLDIRYAVQMANAQPGSSRMVPLGTFAGTRGRALPLIGVVLEMNGNDDVQFSAEAIFLNAPSLRASGRRVVLAGPSGREPLVGLRIAIERVPTVVAAEAIAQFPAGADAAPAKPDAAPARSGRVRVFRSRPRQDAATG
jgi:hypothetical protein